MSSNSGTKPGQRSQRLEKDHIFRWCTQRQRWKVDDWCTYNRLKNTITIRTWNVRTLRTAGKLKELMYEMYRWRWTVLDSVENDVNVLEGLPRKKPQVLLSGKESKEMNGVEFCTSFRHYEHHFWMQSYFQPTASNPPRRQSHPTSPLIKQISDVRLWGWGFRTPTWVNTRSDIFILLQFCIPLRQGSAARVFFLHYPLSLTSSSLTSLASFVQCVTQS